MQNLGLSQVHWAFVRLELEGERHLAGGIKVALRGRTLKVEGDCYWQGCLDPVKVKVFMCWKCRVYLRRMSKE